MILALIDIGGTHLRLSLLDKQKGDGFEEGLFFEHKEKTSLGKEALSLQLKEIKVLIEKQCQLNKKKLEGLSVGFPANLSFCNKKYVIPGSGANISLKKGEWDDVSIQDLFQSIFPQSFVFVINDAFAQCLGGVHQYLNAQKPSHFPIHVAYVGMGTGLGGAFCKVMGPDHIDFISDGHIYDVMIKGPKGVCIAEDVLSGSGFLNQFGQKPETIFLDTRYIEQLKETTAVIGKMCYHLLKYLLVGPLKKRDTLWSKDEINKVAKTELFLFGASFAKASLGRDLWFDTCQKHLLEDKALLKKPKLYFIPEPDRAAMQGLFHFILKK